MSEKKNENHGAKGGHGGHKKHEEHEEHEEHVNHEAWVIPYADLLTLLLAMFLALYASATAALKESKTAEAAYKAQLQGVADVFKTETGKSVVAKGENPAAPDNAGANNSVIDLGLDAARAVRAEQALQAAESAAKAKAAENAQLLDVEAQIKAEAEKLGIGGSIDFRREERGLVVTILSDNVLFESGEAQLMPEGTKIIDELGLIVMKLQKPISIEGHTDSRPVSGKFASNWELSTARATNVLRYLVDKKGFPAERISASGYADTKPVESNATAEGQGKNRRVEVVVLSTASAATNAGMSTAP